MGNEIINDQQSGEIINNMINKLATQPISNTTVNPFQYPREENPQSNTKTFSKMKNTKFSRG